MESISPDPVGDLKTFISNHRGHIDKKLDQRLWD
jgi:hypothetical protein